MSQPKRALVLGCGAVAGAAWSIPVLEVLQRELDWDARQADLMIGTSIGAVLGALLAAGVSVERMAASQRGEITDCVWNYDTDSGGALPPLPALRWPAWRLALRGVLGDVHPLTGLCGLSLQGRTDMRGFMRLIDSVVPAGAWAPHPKVWMMVVDVATGQRVALGRDDAPKVPMNLAVCASHAVPMCCPTVTVDGRTYIDGGVASPTSADLVLGSGVEEAIVLAPFTSTQMDQPRSPLAMIERRVRRTMTEIVDRECAMLQAAGIRVIRLAPGPEDLEAIGYNMLDPKRRLQVFETSVRTAPAAVAQALAAARS
jgi:NTE family protein